MTELAPITPVTEQQQLAIDLLCAGSDMATVAARVGVKLRTLWEWRFENAFAQQLRAHNEAIQAWAHDRHMQLAEPALNALRECLSSDKENIRLQAARTILDRVFETKEDTEEDLRRLQLVFARDLIKHLNTMSPEDLVAQVRRLAQEHHDR